MEAYKAWFVVYISIGVWTCITLAVYKQGSAQIKFLMTILIALLLTPALDAYCQLIFAEPIHWLHQFRINLTWIYGPIMLLLVQSVLLKNISKQAIAVHLSAYFLITIGQVTDLLASSVWLLLALFIQVFGYLAYSFWQLTQHKSKINNLAQQHQNSSYYWILFLILGLALAMVVDVVIIVLLINQVTLNIELVNLYASGLGVFVCIISLFSVIQPALLSSPIATADTTQITEKPTTPAHNRDILLSQSLVITLTEQLQQLIQSEQIHLDCDMSLPKLAAKLNINTHQLSELLNVHLDTTFYDFLNQHRFLVAQSLLTQKNNPLSVSDIVYQAGFNNRSSFYKVFKQKTGLTPSQFKKSHVAQ